MMSFVIAGRDTTASALSWVFWELTQHADVCERVVEEIDRVLQGESPTYDDVTNKMPYMQAVIKETMRLHPPIPMVFIKYVVNFRFDQRIPFLQDTKMAINDDTLPDGTHIPAGANVVYRIYVMGRLESIWPNALKFDPDRWLTSDPAPSAYKYPVFNAGPRLCLGMRLGLTETAMLTAMVLQKYKITASPGGSI